MNSGLIIRDAKPHDAVPIRLCVEAAYGHYVSRMGLVPGPMQSDYDDVISRSLVSVAELAGDVIGVLVLIPSESGLLLDNIAIHPRYQKRGHGRCLLDYAQAQTRERGCARLNLYTHECMYENIQMYKNRGYVETDRRTEDGYKRVYMRRSF